MSLKPIVAAVVASVCLATVAAAGTATAGGPPSMAAGPAFGFVPSRNVNHQKARGRSSLLSWHTGPVMHSTTCVPVFWASGLSNWFLSGGKVTGRDDLYSRFGRSDL